MIERGFYLYVGTKAEYDSAVGKIKSVVGSDYIMELGPFSDCTGYLPYVAVMVTKRQWHDLKRKLNLTKTWL